MSNRSLLDEPCDLNADPGTKPWARAVAREIRFRAKQFDSDVESLQSMIAIAADHNAWRPLGYISLDAFLIAEANFTQTIIDAVRNAKKGAKTGDVIAQVADARAKPLADVGPPTKEEKDNVGNTNNKLNGTTVDYTLRRLARDNPKLLDKIEAGELTVNQAAIQAGIRKKPTPEDQCLRAFKKCSDKAGLLLRLQEYLEAVSRHKESTDGRRLD
jgi:hypothetical protein